MPKLYDVTHLFNDIEVSRAILIWSIIIALFFEISLVCENILIFVEVWVEMGGCWTSAVRPIFCPWCSAKSCTTCATFGSWQKCLAGRSSWEQELDPGPTTKPTARFPIYYSFFINKK